MNLSSQMQHFIVFVLAMGVFSAMIFTGHDSTWAENALSAIMGGAGWGAINGTSQTVAHIHLPGEASSAPTDTNKGA